MDKLWLILKSTLWILLELLVFIAIMGAITALLSYLALNLSDTSDYGNTEGSLDPYSMLLVEYIPLLIGSMISLYLTHKLIFNRSFDTTGFVRNNLLLSSGKTGLMALSILLSGFVLLYLVNYLDIVEIEFTPLLFFGFLLLFIIQSSFEEIVSRSFMIPSITQRANVWVALLISSSLFAMLHLTNPNISILSTVNIFLAGLVMGLIFLYYKSIWPAISFHATWNFFQGSFFGFEVSGFDVYSLIDSKEVGPDWITGGPFGFEGSVIASILLAAYSLYLYNQWKSVSPKSKVTCSLDGI